MSESKSTILVVSDEASSQRADEAWWSTILPDGFLAQCTRVGEHSIQADRLPAVAAILITHDEPASLVSVLQRVLAAWLYHRPPVIMIGPADIATAVQTIKVGAADYLVKAELTASTLAAAIHAAIAAHPTAATPPSPHSVIESPVGKQHADLAPTSLSATSPTALAQAALDLQESEARFQMLADNISQFTWMADATGWIFWYNRRWFDYTGTTLEQMQGWGWQRVHHPDHVDRVVARYQRCIELGKPWEDTFPLRRHDGKYSWFLSRAMPIRDETGQILRWFGTNTDITKLKTAETALADREARLRSFVESNVVGIMHCDIHGNITQANDELLRIIGYSREDLNTGRLKWTQLTPPEYVPIDQQRIAEAKVLGACTPFEKEYIRQDGSRIPVLIGFTLLGDAREEAIAFILDLTQQKQTENALRTSQDRLNLAINAAELGTWDWNLLTQELTWDARCKAMFGLSPEAEVNIDLFFAGLHEDDREPIRQLLDSLMAGQSADYDVEYCTVGIEDGVERWIAAKGKVLYDDTQQVPQRFVGTVMDISDRKRADRASRASEQRLQMALEGSGGGMWDWNIATDEDYLSPQWLEMLGYQPGDLPEKKSSWEKLIHPEDRPWVVERLHQHLQDSTVPYKFEYRLLTKSGDWKWIACYGRVVVRDDQGKPLRMSGIHHDISDRKRMEAVLRQSENRYRILANAVSQLMWINDADGNVEFYNQQWETYTGRADLVLGVGLWAHIIHPEDMATTAAVRQQAIANKAAYEVECRLQRHDGVYRWHLARVVPLKDNNGRVLSWYGTATDIHDRKCVAAEREELLEREQAAREAAERANRIKDEFLAILSHELRSPLNPILGWSRLLQTRKFDDTKTAQALATIERNAKLQTQLIDDLLDIAKILRGKLRLENKPVSLKLSIIAAIETVQTAAAAKSITIRADYADDVAVYGDEARLQQIVWNLLSNAIKFTPEGGRVDLALQQIEQTAHITVTDNGKGISPDFLPHLFKSFQQEDVSITRKHGGLGLGLAIVRYLVEAHGGRIIADSPGENQGATFTVHLPVVEPELREAAAPPFSEGDFDLSGLRILAIDDSADACALIETVLTQYGADVTVACSAQAGLDSFSKVRPHILVSDIGMPDMDGFTLIRQIRQLPPEQGGQIPAIALTAYTRDIDQQKAYDSGYQQHLPKPIEIDHLIKSIVALTQLDR